jgi:hypothetical protein
MTRGLNGCGQLWDETRETWEGGVGYGPVLTARRWVPRCLPCARGPAWELELRRRYDPSGLARTVRDSDREPVWRVRQRPRRGVLTALDMETWCECGRACVCERRQRARLGATWRPAPRVCSWPGERHDAAEVAVVRALVDREGQHDAAWCAASPTTEVAERAAAIRATHRAFHVALTDGACLRGVPCRWCAP